MDKRTDIILKDKKLEPLSPPIPTWKAPKHELKKEFIQKGLTLKILKQEIDAINKKSKKNIGNVPPIWVGPVAAFIGFILFIIGGATSSNSADWACLFIGCLALSAGIVLIFYRILQILRGFDKTKEYVQFELNEKYDPRGIKWSVLSAKKANNYYYKDHDDGERGGRWVYRYTSHYIIVSDIKAKSVQILKGDIHGAKYFDRIKEKKEIADDEDSLRGGSYDREHITSASASYNQEFNQQLEATPSYDADDFYDHSGGKNGGERMKYSEKIRWKKSDKKQYEYEKIGDDEQRESFNVEPGIEKDDIMEYLQRASVTTGANLDKKTLSQMAHDIGV